MINSLCLVEDERGDYWWLICVARKCAVDAWKRGPSPSRGRGLRAPASSSLFALGVDAYLADPAYLCMPSQPELAGRQCR